MDHYFGSTTALLRNLMYLMILLIIIDFKESKIADMSAIDALNKITERYAKINKRKYI
jgi:SulP family sulfate permease